MVGNLLYLCEKSAVQDALVNHVEISTGIQEEIDEQILDSSLPIVEVRRYFTKYAWVAVENKSKSLKFVIKIIATQMLHFS